MKVEVKCSECHQTFNTADHMIERQSEGLVLTILVCPHCNNEMVVQLDNQTTLSINHRLLNVLRRMGKTQFLTGRATPFQEKRQNELTRLLAATRQELIDKYDKTVYQFDGKEYKLDFHVPNMKISEV